MYSYLNKVRSYLYSCIKIHPLYSYRYVLFSLKHRYIVDEVIHIFIYKIDSFFNYNDIKLYIYLGVYIYIYLFRDIVYIYTKWILWNPAVSIERKPTAAVFIHCLYSHG